MAPWLRVGEPATRDGITARYPSRSGKDDEHRLSSAKIFETLRLDIRRSGTHQAHQLFENRPVVALQIPKD